VSFTSATIRAFGTTPRGDLPGMSPPDRLRVTLRSQQSTLGDGGAPRRPRKSSRARAVAPRPSDIRPPNVGSRSCTPVAGPAQVRRTLDSVLVAPVVDVQRHLSRPTSTSAPGRPRTAGFGRPEDPASNCVLARIACKQSLNRHTFASCGTPLRERFRGRYGVCRRARVPSRERPRPGKAWTVPKAPGLAEIIDGARVRETREPPLRRHLRRVSASAPSSRTSAQAAPSPR
jgi:hypothetical protein